MDDDNQIDPEGLSSEDLLRQAREDLTGAAPASAVPPTPELSTSEVPPRASAPPPELPIAGAVLPPNPSASAPAPPAGLGFNTPEARAPMAPPPKSKRNLPIRQILIGVGVVGFLLFGWLGSRGKTSSDDLAVGDCFEIPSGETFTNVTDQPCGDLHEAQIYGRVISIQLTQAEDLCIEKLIPYLESYEMPEDASLATLEGDDAGVWFCAVTSASGQLKGSVLLGF